VRAVFQQLERSFNPPQGSRNIGALLNAEAVGLVQVIQQLERVPHVLSRSFGRPSATRAVATIESAAPLGATPQVHGAAAIDGDLRQDGAARHGAAVDPSATVGEEATGRKHDLICH
jgi:hypothetical protein